ncbi:hypothetical protein M9Y10_041468 [Tritrichomonas musculus]|uniref:Bromo domain-containing protein n=1 Tax=Tritrichomonas musculus TaxID=1915356 RepID=A0ABR2K4K4_9EUKA
MGDNLPPQCLKITTDFIDDKLSLLFKDPFHPDKEIQDEYYSIIKKPMDLSTVMRKLKENAYISIGDWSDDMNLIFDNAIKYNGESSLVGSIALYLKQKFEKKKKSIENLNSRNYEDQIIAYTRELNQTLLKPPDSLSVEIDTQASINRLNNFTISQFEQIKDKLNFLIQENKKDQIISDLKNTGVDFDPNADQQIDFAKLSRNSLLALEKSCNK